MWKLNRRKEPITCYEIYCNQCGFRETVELRNSNFDSLCLGEFARVVDVLPKKCPTCNGKLCAKHLKIPIFDIRQ